MKQNWRRIAIALGFVSGLAMLASGCVVRASGAVRARPVYVVDVPPPQPRYVRVTARPGQIWIRGHYQYVTGRWVWRPGRWENARAGYRWEPGRWERRGNRWHWVDGTWVRATVRVRDHRRAAPPPPPPPPRRVVRDHRRVPAYPTTAPPPPRSERPGARPGYVFIRGHWEWRRGRWVWKAGHWKRVRSGFRWVPGHWENRGDRYVWVAGHWEKAVRVRDHRRKRRPNERVPTRRSDGY